MDEGEMDSDCEKTSVDMGIIGQKKPLNSPLKIYANIYQQALQGINQHSKDSRFPSQQNLTSNSDTPNQANTFGDIRIKSEPENEVMDTKACEDLSREENFNDLTDANCVSSQKIDASPELEESTTSFIASFEPLTSEKLESTEDTLNHESESSGRPHKCDICDKTFIQSCHLTVHRRFHTGERPYVCEFCDKSFIRGDTLKRHVRIHTGEKPYKCMLCGQAFSARSSRKKHMKTHNAEKMKTDGTGCTDDPSTGLESLMHMVVKSFDSDNYETIKIKPEPLDDTKSVTDENLQGSDSSRRDNLSDENFDSTALQTGSSASGHHLQNGSQNGFCISDKVSENESSFSETPQIGPVSKKGSNGRQYKCNICNKTFSQSGSLTIHMRYHTGEKPYICKFCSKSFVRNDAMKKHMRTHRDEVTYKCTLCDKIFFELQDRDRHFKAHFKNRLHISNNHGKLRVKSDLASSADSAEFTSVKPSGNLEGIQIKLEPHSPSNSSSGVAQADLHNDFDVADPNYFALTRKIFGDSGDLSSLMSRPHKCDQCPKAFTQLGHLIVHKRSHTGEKPYSCKFCDKSFIRPDTLKKHLRTHTGEKPYTCTTCDRSFSEACSLKRHIRTHTGEKPYSCVFCDATFAETTTLRRHTRRRHAGSNPARIVKEDGTVIEFSTIDTTIPPLEPKEKTHICSTCNKAFGDPNHLRNHRRTHTGEKPYKCVHCGKAFSESSNMKMHMRLHTGVKPHKCNICERTFTQAGGLKSHLRTHTGERPFRCSECDQSFAQSGNLRSHMRIHTGERKQKCHLCEKTFAQSSVLKAHLRLHTDERPHQCPKCDKKFNQSSHLTVHMRCHTGEKPYSCEYCGKAFAQLSNKKRHVAKHISDGIQMPVEPAVLVEETELGKVSLTQVSARGTVTPDYSDDSEMTTADDDTYFSDDQTTTADCDTSFSAADCETSFSEDHQMSEDSVTVKKEPDSE